jgi:hypothetical protein
MKERTPSRVSPARDERARDWELTAYVAWAVAIAAGVWSSQANGRHTGDILLAGYLALLGLGFWLRAIRIRFAEKAPSFTPALANALLVALALAFVLGVADLASGGRY